MTTLGPDDKKKVNTALRTISDAWSEMEAARELVSTTKKELCDDLELNPRVFTRVAKLFHKQNLDEEDKQHADVKALFKQVTSK